MIEKLVEDRVVAADTVQENVSAGVYKVLLGGMIASSLLFAAGIVRALLHPQYIPLAPEWIRGQYHLAVVEHELARLDPMGLMLVATVLLVLTPIVRVIVSIRGFALDQNRKFVWITSAVLAVLVVTVLLGFLGLR